MQLCVPITRASLETSISIVLAFAKINNQTLAVQSGKLWGAGFEIHEV